MSDSRVFIRPPTPEDGNAFLSAARESRALHGQWIHPPLTRSEFDLYLERFQQPDHQSRLICLHDTGALVGVINLNNIIRGYFQNSFLGFYAFLPHAGCGLMLEGLQLVAQEAFTSLDLHRLEANIQSENRRSIQLVQRTGFSREGFSPNYLRIAGVWRDHERWALLKDDPPTG